MIIVIGGTGFIGKHLSILLHERGIDNISFSRNPDHEFLQTFAPTTRAKNISELAESKEIISSANTLIYLASRSTPASKSNSIASEWSSNIGPAIETISTVLEINPAIHIVHLSSGGTVYGPEHTQPISEDAELCPITPYAFGKIAIENYLKYISRTSRASYTIFRVSNPVGKWHCSSKQGFIGTSIANIKSGNTVTIFGDGETIRDYVDADEVSSAILEAAINQSDSKNKIWNVGSGRGASLNSIIAELDHIVGKKTAVEYLPGRSTDLNYNVLNCQRVENELNWRAKSGLRDIIKKVWMEY